MPQVPVAQSSFFVASKEAADSATVPYTVADTIPAASTGGASEFAAPRKESPEPEGLLRICRGRSKPWQS